MCSYNVYIYIWEFPKVMGTVLEVPMIRAIVYWGLYWGTLSLGNYHIYIYIQIYILYTYVYIYIQYYIQIDNGTHSCYVYHSYLLVYGLYTLRYGLW